jgi:large subunit ribosomal protein L2
MNLLIKMIMLKYYKGYTPSLRHVCLLDKKIVFNFEAVKYLTAGSFFRAGRNNSGHITVRHKGSGCKNVVRLVSNKVILNNVIGTVLSIEYCPRRSSFISLIYYKNGVYNYTITNNGSIIGSTIINFTFLPELLSNGSTSIIKNMPAGSLLYNFENYPGLGTKLVKSAGCSSLLLKKQYNTCIVKMPSGKIKIISSFSQCSIGTVSNKDYKFTNLGKAGRSRWLGIRPSVRGVAMNPVDHPHGGGEGRKSGKKCSTSPWGKLTKGQKTSRSFFNV